MYSGKPNGSFSFGDLGPQLIARIKAAAGTRLRTPPPVSPASSLSRRMRATPYASGISARQVILLGASTGGTEALREVLTRLPAGLPGIAIVQHIPPVFSKAFADRLNTQCAFEVREAVDGERLTPGLALIAPGNFHLMLQWKGDHYCARVTGGPQIWHQRPAVDLLFKSAADCGAAPHAIAGVLTGMGKDGAEGLLRLRNLEPRPSRRTRRVAWSTECPAPLGKTAEPNASFRLTAWLISSSIRRPRLRLLLPFCHEQSRCDRSFHHPDR